MIPALIGAGAGIASGILGGNAAKSAARTQRAAAKDQLKFAKKIFKRVDQAGAGARDQNIADATTTQNRGVGLAVNEYNTMADLSRNLRDGTLGDATRLRDSSREEARRVRTDTIGLYNPTRAAGTNALAAYDFNLGIGSKPANYTGPALSAGERFIRDEGIGTVQGSMAARGGLNSGETLAELQRLGSGIASQSRDRQQAELFARGQQGLTATDRIADAERAYFGDVTGIDRNYFGDRLGANAGYAAQMGAAKSGYTDRRLGLDAQGYGNIAGARNNYVNALAGASSNLGQQGADAIANRGDAGAAGAIGSANAWSNAINTGLGTWQYLGGGGFGNQSTDYRSSMPNGGVVTGPMGRSAGMAMQPRRGWNALAGMFG
jgi:hypothetical protein